MDEARKAQPEATETLDLLRADVMAAQERWNEARTFLETARSRNPRSLKYRLALARLAERERGAAESLKILDRTENDLGPQPEIQLSRLACWARQGGNDARAAVARLAEGRNQIPKAERPAFLNQLAAAEILLDQQTMARQHLRELSALDPHDIRVLLGRFDLALAAADHSEAAELVQKIRQVEGEQGTNWRLVEGLELIDQARRGDGTTLKKVRTLAAEIEAKRSGWWGAPLLNARIAELENKPEEARSSYMDVIRLGNEQPSVVRRVVQLLYRQNRFEDIERLAQMLRDRRSALAEFSKVANAITSLRKGDPKQGLTLLRQVVSDSSVDFSDQLILGHFCLAAGQSPEAETHFKRATELGPGVPEVWLSYVQFLFNAGKVDKARLAVKEAFKVVPVGQSSLTVAQCAVMVGDDGLAEQQIESSLKADPQDPEALRIAIAFYLPRGRTDLVERYLDVLLNHAPRSTGYELAWARRTKALMLIRTGQPAEMEKALDEIDQNLRTRPGNPEDLRLKASIFATRPSQRAEAIEIFESLASTNGLDRSGRFTLAQLYLEQGKDEGYLRTDAHAHRQRT